MCFDLEVRVLNSHYTCNIGMLQVFLIIFVLPRGRKGVVLFPFPSLTFLSTSTIVHCLMPENLPPPLLPDIWSAGCVFAELLLGQPIFLGDSGVDQLVEIIKVLGTPTKEQIRQMNSNYTEFKFPQIKAHPWHKVRMYM